MAGAATEIKFVGEFTEQDVELAGLPTNQFREEMEHMGLRVKDGELPFAASNWQIKSKAVAHTLVKILGKINLRYGAQLKIINHHGNESSIMGQVENVMYPMYRAEVTKACTYEGDGEDDDQFDKDYYRELHALDGYEGNLFRLSAVTSSDARTAVRVGSMLTLRDLSSELFEFAKVMRFPDTFRDHHNALLFYRAGEILVKTDGVCLADFASSKRLSRIALTDQFNALVHLMTGVGPDSEQQDIANSYPVLTKAHFGVASQVMKALLEPQAEEIKAVAETVEPDFAPHVREAVSRFLALSANIDRVRSVITERLVSNDSKESSKIRELVLEGLNNPANRAVVIELFRLGDPANIWELYRQSVESGNSELATLIKAQASELPERPFMLVDDLPLIYNSDLRVDAERSVTVDQLQQVVRSLKLYGVKDFEFEGEELLFKGFRYGRLKTPSRIKVSFDKQQPQRRFSIKLEYLGSDEKKLTHCVDFDLQRGGVVEWGFLEAVSDPLLAGVYEDSVDLTSSVLDVIKVQCDLRAQEREALKGSITVVAPTQAAKSGEHIPAPKFERQGSRQSRSILSESLPTNGNGKGSVRDIIELPVGNELEELLADMRHHPESVRTAILEGIENFNKADKQVGIEALRSDTRTGLLCKWGCRTSVGHIRVFLEPIGSEQSETGRVRRWRPLIVGKRAGFYKRLRQKGYDFQSKTP